MSSVITSPLQVHFRNVPTLTTNPRAFRYLNVGALFNSGFGSSSMISKYPQPATPRTGDRPPPVTATPPMGAPPGQSPPDTTNTSTTTGSDTSSIVNALLGAYASAFGSSGSVGAAQPAVQPQTAPVVVAPAPGAGGASTGQVVLIVLTMAALAFGIYKYAKRKKGGARDS